MTTETLASFRARAQKQAERIPSQTVVLDVGQYVSGRVRKVGQYNHPEYGNSPVVVFEPAEQETNVEMVPGPKGKAIKLSTVAPDVAYVIVGIGTVLGKLDAAQPGDLLYIERVEDGKSARGAYKNFEVLAERPGRPVMPLSDLVRIEVKERLAAQGIPSEPIEVMYDADEEPFG